MRTLILVRCGAGERLVGSESLFRHEKRAEQGILVTISHDYVYLSAYCLPVYSALSAYRLAHSGLYALYLIPYTLYLILRFEWPD